MAADWKHQSSALLVTTHCLYELSSSVSRGYLNWLWHALTCFTMGFQVQPARGHCRLVPLSVISCLICFLGFVLLFLPDTVFVVAQLRHRIALVLFRKMVSSANTGTGYEPARLRGYFDFGACLGFTCWDVNSHWGCERFLGDLAILRIYLPIVVCFVSLSHVQ